MPRPTLDVLMQSAFAPLIKVSGLSHLQSALRTADLPEHRRVDQYRRLRHVDIDGREILLLSSGHFIVRMTCEDDCFLAFNVENASADEQEEAANFLLSEGLSGHVLEECLFLYLRYYLKSNYRLKREYRTIDACRNILDVVDEKYVGHQIYDIIDVFEKIIICKVPSNSIYRDTSMWFIATKLASSLEFMRSPLIEPSLARKIASLLPMEFISPDNLYVSLTAIHWKYIFFELYKYVEQVFYLPWHVKLKSELSSALSAASLARICRQQIEWRAKESDSIRHLFDLLDSQLFQGEIKNTTSFAFAEEDRANRHAYGRRVYKIRNTLVHQQDYEDASPITVPEEEWPIIIEFMCDLVHDLYRRYASEICG